MVLVSCSLSCLYASDEYRMTSHLALAPLNIIPFFPDHFCNFLELFWIISLPSSIHPLPPCLILLSLEHILFSLANCFRLSWIVLVPGLIPVKAHSVHHSSFDSQPLKATLQAYFAITESISESSVLGYSSLQVILTEVKAIIAFLLQKQDLSLISGNCQEYPVFKANW